MTFFDNGSDAYVNPVNCVGVMGAGLAKVFRAKYPDMYAIYRKDCFDKRVKLGEMHVVYTQGVFIINFPTKHTWREKSQLSWIEKGLEDLVRVIRDTDMIKSISIPALGCGLGGLRWDDVLPLIESAADRLPEVDVRIFP